MNCPLCDGRKERPTTHHCDGVGFEASWPILTSCELCGGLGYLSSYTWIDPYPGQEE